MKMKKLLLLWMLLLLGVGSVLGIVAHDSDVDGILDSAEAAAVSCNMACPTGYHCEIPNGTVIYKTVNKYSGSELNNRAAADAICRAQKPAQLTTSINIHALISFKELTNLDLPVSERMSDFILYMPERFGYNDFLPLYWYNRSTNNLVQFASTWKDAMNGKISKSNYAGTGDNEMYWTGSAYDGRYYWFEYGNRTCDGWKSSGSTIFGQVGNPLSTNMGWLSYNQSNCSQQRKILCAAELAAGASTGSCLSNCTPTKIKCEPGDCGLQSDGCGGKILCNTSCSSGMRCRSPIIRDPFAFDLKCTGCKSCDVGEIRDKYKGDSGNFGMCRNSNWKCQEYEGDCSDWFYKGFDDAPLCKGAVGGSTCEYKVVDGVQKPNKDFKIDEYANTLNPPGCKDNIGNFEQARKMWLPKKNVAPPHPTPEESCTPQDYQDYFALCTFAIGCGSNSICDQYGCESTFKKCPSLPRPSGYWDGCGYGCCTLKTGYTGRACPSFMNPGKDPEYHDSG
jgi:hypothetical protein